jgi:hypothetical protein
MRQPGQAALKPTAQSAGNALAVSVHLHITDKVRPLKNVQFWPSTRKAIISTTGILLVFRGLKFESDAVIGQKGALCKGLKAA